MSDAPAPRAAANRAVTEQLWADLYRRDFDAVGAHFHADGTYTDVPTPAEDVAAGPAEIAARLRLGLGPLERIEHDIGHIVAEGDLVLTEHVETWFWDDDTSVALPFVSVHEFRDGKIARWADYWDLQTLLGAAPQWWLDHIMAGWQT
ncbi:MAG: nuclear transport factor 2 family protein [Acidimicrobiales bacterium]|nr:nuclear transport factor 2 family protein [Acidimicrobiales bacterium]